jgi:hypothetical protein
MTDSLNPKAGDEQVPYCLISRDLKKVEGYQFTLRAQKNSQESVRITDEAAVPKSYRRIEARIDGVIWETALSLLPEELAKNLESSIQETRPDNDAIKGGCCTERDSARSGGTEGHALESGVKLECFRV